jgi:hypothetical protein
VLRPWGNLRLSALPHTQGRVLINAQIAAGMRLLCGYVTTGTLLSNWYFWT